jgi:hypothetical protein
MDALMDDTFVDNENMNVDNNGLWRAAIHAAKHTFESSMRELVNNISTTGDTIINCALELVKTFDGDIFTRMSVEDDGDGFTSKEEYNNSLELANSNCSGNNNYGYGRKSPGQMENDSVICMGTDKNGLKEVSMFACPNTQFPKKIKLSAANKLKILEKFKGKTFSISIHGRRVHYLPIDILINLLVENIGQYINDTTINIDQLSFSYCNLIKNGNTLTFNEQILPIKEIINYEHREMFDKNGLYCKMHVKIYYDKNDKCIRYHCKVNYDDGETNQGWQQKKLTRFKFNQNPPNDYIIVSEFKLDIIEVDKMYKNESIKGIHIESEGIIISTDRIEIDGHPNLRCKLYDIIEHDKKTIEEIEENTIPTILTRHYNKTLTTFDKEYSPYVQLCIKEAKNKTYDLVEDELVEDELVEDELVEDELVEDELVEDEQSEDEQSDDEQSDDEQPGDEQSEDEQPGDEQLTEQSISGNINYDSDSSTRSNRSKNRFSEKDKRLAKECQPIDELTGLSHRHYGEASNYDYDHKIELQHGGGGDRKNCQVLNKISHSIKTYDPDYYSKIMSNPVEIAKFRTEFIIDIINNSKKAGISLEMTKIASTLFSN